MVTRIFVATTVQDARAEVRKKQILSCGISVDRVEFVDVYTIDKKLTQRQILESAQLFANPVTQRFFINEYVPEKFFHWAIETGFLPGVTDNVAATVKECISDRLQILFKIGEGIYTSQITFLSGPVAKEKVKTLATSLINPLIERAAFKDHHQYIHDHGMDSIIPKVHLVSAGSVDTVDMNIPDDELIELGRKGIKNQDGSRRGPLALDLASMKTIAAYFAKRKRKPTDIELESIAQTWSEHCKHTIFSRPLDEITDGLYRHYIKRATEDIRKRLGKKDFCVSVFTDNSGAIEFDSQYLVTHKVETHNSPSALDPFGGSITGIVGVNRDAIGFGLGAQPIANTYGFCLADPSITISSLYRDTALTQPLLSPRRIMDGVIAGVNSGGNCSGIPTPQGFVSFDHRFAGKPLVFVGTVGLIPKQKFGRKLYRKSARPGNYIVMVGGRVGLDGIHGATFSSEALTSGSPATAVQIGDPITQKKLSDALVKEARDKGLYTSITDNGAGGLSCSVAEMAKESGGCLVDLSLVPLKYPGLAPWQIWISESQERMTLAVPSKKWKHLQTLLKKRGVEATMIGRFTNTGRCEVRYRKKTVMDIDMNFLHNGIPNEPQQSHSVTPHHLEPVFPTRKEWTNVYLDMLARLNLASFSWISMQFDHEVQGTSVTKPLQGKGRVNADATVLRPVHSSLKGLVLTQALYPQYSDIDSYHMAAACVDTAVRNAIAAGADPEKIALLDNFCWCSAKDPERLAQLKKATAACYDLATVYRTPFISGKDSMFNDFVGYDHRGESVKISIPPTLLISVIGIIDNVLNAITLDAKVPGDLIYLLGETDEELGSSEYYHYVSEKRAVQAIGNRVPVVNAQKNYLLYRALAQAILRNLVSSAQSVSHGGLAYALAKTALGGMMGIDVSLEDLPGRVKRDDCALFSESQGRVVVTVDPKKQKQFEKIVGRIPYRFLGVVTEKPGIRIEGITGQSIVNTDVTTLQKAYTSRFAGY